MSDILDQSISETSIQPTANSGRILQLDIFRGFAIFGIFMVNILVMNVSFVYRGEWLAETASTFNNIIDWCLQFFFFSKFFPIFSFLFGIGVALQIRSLKSKRIPSSAFLIRRFTALLVFGMCHILFIWSGDILHLYALFGFLLIFMYRMPPVVIFLSAIVLVFFPFFDDLYEYIIHYFDVNPSGNMNQMTRDHIHTLKVNGSYASGIQLRLDEYGYMLPFVVSIMIPFALAMTLLGLYAVKSGIIDRIQAFAKKIIVPFLISFVLIITYRFLFQYWILEAFDIGFGSILSFFLWTLYFVSEVMISFLYLLLIVFALQTKVGFKLLSPLQYVGRMAFTNYILQSVIGYLIMRTFGYFESFDLLGCVLIVIAVYSVQIPLSWYWLKYFKFGPLEWLWRCISYWKVLPIRKS